MKIAIDARMINHPGIGTYIKGLLSGMPRDEKITLVGDPESLDTYRNKFSIAPCNIPIYSISEQIKLPGYFKNCDLVHFPHYAVPICFKHKFVVTVHDLIQLKFKYGKLYRRMAAKYILGHAIQKSKKVIAVSNHTKNDLIECFNTSEDKINVIYEASIDNLYKITDTADLYKARKRLKLPKDYILYVGSTKKHKNIDSLIKVFKRLKQEDKIKEDLVLAGPSDQKYEEPGIHQHGVVSPEDLIYYYNLAKVLAHVSLYEGFGLTVLEAFACGLPVMASSITSIPEVAGQAACLVDPANLDEMKNSLYNILSNTAISDDLSLKGQKRAKEFSWKLAAKKTLDTYREALS